jgi:hypothetical protein
MRKKAIPKKNAQATFSFFLDVIFIWLFTVTLCCFQIVYFVLFCLGPKDVRREDVAIGRPSR